LPAPSPGQSKLVGNGVYAVPHSLRSNLEAVPNPSKTVMLSEAKHL
jgi:hypothetical protein